MTSSGDMEDNVKQLNDCLQQVVARVEKLESFHGVHSPKVRFPDTGSNYYQEVNGDGLPPLVEPRNVTLLNSSPPPMPDSSVDNGEENGGDMNQVKTVTTRESRTEPDGTTRQITRTVKTAVVKSASYQRTQMPGTAVDGYIESSLPEVTSGLSYMDENRPFEVYRMVGLRKSNQHPTYGISARDSAGRVIVTSVDERSATAKSGLVRPGDVVIEANNQPVRSTQEFEKVLRGTGDGTTLKLIPASLEVDQDIKAFYRSNFDYTPGGDMMLKAKDIGLPFKAGDVLEILDDSDKEWWQAKRVDDNSRIGVIPSKKSVEKQKKHGWIYDEVGRLSPYGRRVLLILGAAGVGRRTLKGRLLRHDPQQFATVVPCTSRGPRHGEVDARDYVFLEKGSMQKAITDGEYVEWGELKDNYYGTTLDAVRKVIRTGKVCVLDCSPQAIRHLYNTEFMPYIVFVSPPPMDELKQLYSSVMANSIKKKSDEDLSSIRQPTDEELEKTCEEGREMENTYKQYFDLNLVNRNSEVTFRRLLDSLEAIKTQPQWVPISWLNIK